MSDWRKRPAKSTPDLFSVSPSQVLASLPPALAAKTTQRCKDRQGCDATPCTGSVYVVATAPARSPSLDPFRFSRVRGLAQESIWLTRKSGPRQLARAVKSAKVSKVFTLRLDVLSHRTRKWGHSRFPPLILNLAVLVSTFEGGVIYLLLNGSVAEWRHSSAVGGTKWRSEVKS